MDCCLKCENTEKKVLARGLCSICYRNDRKSIFQCPSCKSTKHTEIISGICQACYSANKRLENPDIFLKSRVKNADKTRAYVKQYERSKPEKKAAREAKRRFLKTNACPKWADLELISEFYKNCPEGFEVDHVIPLSHGQVCGLHVLENLQYLPEKDNRKKSNKFDLTSNNDSWRNT